MPDKRCKVCNQVIHEDFILIEGLCSDCMNTDIETVKIEEDDEMILG